MPSDIELLAEKAAQKVTKLQEDGVKALAPCAKKSKEFNTANSVAWECADLVKELRESLKKEKDAGKQKTLQEKLKGAETQFKKFVEGRKRVGDEYAATAGEAAKVVATLDTFLGEVEKMQKALPRAACEGDPREVAKKLTAAHGTVSLLRGKLEQHVQDGKGLPKAPTI